MTARAAAALRPLAAAILSRLERWFAPPVPSPQSDCADDEPPTDARPPAGAAVHLFMDEGLLRLDGGRLTLAGVDGERSVAPPGDLRLVCLHGRGGVTTPALLALARAGAAVMWRDAGGRIVAMLHTPCADARTRRAQYAAVADDARRLDVAKAFVVAKIEATRDLLRGRGDLAGARALQSSPYAVETATSLDQLRGVEGAAAAAAFARWPDLLSGGFAFEGRRRRPATDPVNAMLSYAYAVVVGEVVSAALAAGLDPQVGFLHAERPGRPARAIA